MASNVIAFNEVLNQMSLPEDAALFSDNKIAHTKLPDGYILRPLQLDDADRGI
jgi:hypothetical protein